MSPHCPYPTQPTQPTQPTRQAHPTPWWLRVLQGSALVGAGLVIALPASGLDSWRVVVRDGGRLESLQGGQSGWSPVWRSRVLTDGDTARTLAHSRARVLLADQSQFTIGADTVVEMTKFELSPQGRTVLFKLQVGKIRATVARAAGTQSRFEVTTPNGVLAARGTEFYVEQFAPPSVADQLGHLAAAWGLDHLGIETPSRSGASTYVQVLHGRVALNSPLGHADLHTGQTALFGQNVGVRLNVPYPGANPPGTGGRDAGQDSKGDKGKQNQGTQQESTPSDASSNKGDGTSSRSQGQGSGDSASSSTGDGTGTTPSGSNPPGPSGNPPASRPSQTTPSVPEDADLRQPSTSGSTSGGTSGPLGPPPSSSGSTAGSTAGSTQPTSPPIGAGTGAAQPVSGTTLQLHIHTR